MISTFCRMPFEKLSMRWSIFVSNPNERNILAAVMNAVVAQRVALFVTDAAAAHHVAFWLGELRGIEMREDRLHAGRLLGNRRVDARDPALRDCAQHRKGLQRSRRVELRGIARTAGHF